MTTPLAGITVLDFGQIYQGPYATLLMAKAGANVIKIEPTGGEPLRRRVLATGKGDTTLPIAMLNANKRAITLNLKTERGRGAVVPDGRARRRAAGEFFPRHDGRARRRLRRAEGGQPAAGLCHRHRLRHHRPGPRQPGDGLHHPGRVRDHERDRRPGRAADEGRPDAGGFHGRHPPLRARWSPRCCSASTPARASSSKWRCRRRCIRRSPPATTITIAPGRSRRAPATARPGLASAPYNTFPTTDGWVAIHVVTEGHWTNLLKAMGREDLNDDPRFRTNADRTAHMAETEAVVAAWTSTLPKMAGGRGDKALPHPLRAGAQRGGGDERPAHA